MSAISSEARAITADERWRSLLEHAAHATVFGTVDTAFLHAVNLDIGGAQFTLLSTDGHPAPGALITSRASFAEVRAGMRVAITPRTLAFTGSHGSSGIPPSPHLGSAIALDGLDYIDSRVERVGGDPFDDGEPPYSIDPPGIGKGIDPAEVAALLTQLARPGSFVPAPDAPPFERAVGARLATARSTFRTALIRTIRELDDPQPHTHSPATKPPELPQATTELIGLGIGLTPSGDDYLVGVLAMLAQHPLGARSYTAVAACIRSALELPDTERTTSVSRHFLLAGCEGEFQSEIAAASRGILTRAPNLAAAFAAAAANGSTSGTDALHGVTDAYLAIETVAIEASTRLHTPSGRAAPNPEGGNS